jgi:hypothetical protein
MKTNSLYGQAWLPALALSLALAVPALAQTTGGAGGTAETSNPAPAAAATQVAPGTIEIIPPGGPVGEEVRIIGSGLPPNAPVVVLGGTDPARLAPLTDTEGEAQRMATSQRPEHVDTSGAFRTLALVPDTAAYGTDFFFALRIGDQVTQPMPYLVQSREPQK